MSLDNQTDTFTSKEKFDCAHDSIVDINSLKPHPKNTNTHPDRQLDFFQKILRYQGQRRAVVVSNLSNCITKGHGLVLAAKKAGWDKIAVDYQDYEDETQEFSDIVADNSLAKLAEHDDEMFKLEALNLQLDVNGFDLELLGVPDLDLSVPTNEQNEMEDSVPEVTESISKVGDLYEFGGHRLLCGDSTDKATVEMLMAGEKADMVFTDPPYGISYDDTKHKDYGTYKSSNFGMIQGDDKPFVFSNFEWLDQAEQIWFGANYYCAQLPQSGSWYVWDKKTEAMQANGMLFTNDFEIAWSKKKHKQEICRKIWAGAINKEKGESRLHPTQKPISLVEWFFGRIKANSVLDLFGGSGSTLIACEKTKRKCFMMELDPHYVDVIVTRWCKYTNQTKIKRNGETVDWVIK